MLSNGTSLCIGFMVLDYEIVFQGIVSDDGHLFGERPLACGLCISSLLRVWLDVRKKCHTFVRSLTCSL